MVPFKDVSSYLPTTAEKPSLPVNLKVSILSLPSVVSYLDFNKADDMVILAIYPNLVEAHFCTTA